MDKFSGDDLIVVKNTGLSYSGYFNFFKDNNISVDIAARFAYYSQPKFGEICRVICKGNVEISDKSVYCVETADMHRMIFLISEEGIEKIGTADMDVYDKSVGSPYELMCGKRM